VVAVLVRADRKLDMGGRDGMAFPPSPQRAPYSIRTLRVKALLAGARQPPAGRNATVPAGYAAAACARANFGLSRLPLVKPPKEWSNPAGAQMGSGADRVAGQEFQVKVTQQRPV
jgi:hypothetical protein